MNTLQAQQHAMLEAICGPGDAAPAGLLRPRPDGGPARLDIYRHAYRARLVAALADNHTVLQRALGDEAFEALALAYLDAQPSRRPSIRWFGDTLAAFMAERDDLVPHPALVDIARMDWALRGVFDAADAPALGVDTLAALPAEAWPGLRLQPHPSVQWLNLQWAIEAAWRALREHDPEAGDEEPTLPEPEAHRHALLVWRQGQETRWRSLSDDEAPLLAAALAGESFGALCAQAEARHGDNAALAAAQALHQWLSEGLISALR